MPWIAGAVLLGSFYQAEEARRARDSAAENQRRALLQQQSDAEAMRTEMARQTAEYAKQGASMQQQADTARMAFEQSRMQYAENKLAMEAKAKEVQAAADEERRKAAAAEASALKARTRGGKRSLLSGARMDAELGVTPMQLGNPVAV